MHVYLVSGMHPKIASSGGVRPYVLGLARGLRAEGIRTTLIGAGPETTDDTCEFLSVTPEFPLSNYEFVKSLWRWTRRSHLETGAIIHAQRPDDLYPFSSVTGCKLVCTLHGNPWRGISQRRTFGRLPYLVAERRALRAANSVISVSRSGLADYVVRYPWISQKSTIIPVGIDLETFHPDDAHSLNSGRQLDPVHTSKPVTLLFAGRLEPEKRIEILFDAMRAMRDPPTAIIAGDGTQESELRSRASGLPVRFLGYQNADQLAALYRAVDALVLPSSYEGLSTVVLEALACGTPVIATPVGDLAYVVSDGSTGYLFDGSAKGLQAVIEGHAASLSGMRPACAAAGSHYGWGPVVERVVALYQGLESSDRASQTGA